jgi:hypothetical protein
MLRMVRQGFATWESSVVREVEIARNRIQNAATTEIRYSFSPTSSFSLRQRMPGRALGVCGTRGRRRVSHD